MHAGNTDISSIRHSVGKAADIGHALGLFSDMAQDHGFTSIDLVMSNRNFQTWMDRSAQARLHYVNFPKDWERRWRKYARVDPLLRASSQAHWPISIAALQNKPDQSHLLAELWDYLVQSNLAAGYVVPVHLPRGAFATLALYHGQTAVLPAPDPTTIFMIGQAFCRAINERFFARAEPPHAALSPREIECLYWASTGKTNDEIGLILGRSPKTARFHLERAAQKLGATNRASAVAKACFGGFIQPH